MRIDTPDPVTYVVDDYDFQFANGLLMTLSVNKGLGDTVDRETTPMAVIFHFSEKPSITDPEAKTPAEDVTVLMKHVITISHHLRTVTPPTQREQDLFNSLLIQPPKTLQ